MFSDFFHFTFTLYRLTFSSSIFSFSLFLIFFFLLFLCCLTLYFSPSAFLLFSFNFSFFFTFNFSLHSLSYFSFFSLFYLRFKNIQFFLFPFDILSFDLNLNFKTYFVLPVSFIPQKVLLIATKSIFGPYILSFEQELFNARNLIKNKICYLKAVPKRRKVVLKISIEMVENS